MLPKEVDLTSFLSSWLFVLALPWLGKQTQGTDLAKDTFFSGQDSFQLGHLSDKVFVLPATQNVKLPKEKHGNATKEDRVIFFLYEQIKYPLGLHSRPRLSLTEQNDSYSNHGYICKEIIAHFLKKKYDFFPSPYNNCKVRGHHRTQVCLVTETLKQFLAGENIPAGT